MFTVGLTGGIGSGKTTIADKFAELGIELIDADQLSRQAVEPGSSALQEITTHFGDSVVTDKGELDRKTLREIVFHAPEERKWLEQLLHPVISELIKAGLRDCKSSYCLLVSPLLLETNQHLLADRILVIDVSEECQLQRAMQRDGSDKETIRAIIAAQIDRNARLEAADDIFNNELPLDSIDARVLELHEKYLKLAGQP